LGKRLRALAQGIEGAALGIHGAVGVSRAELTLRLAHGLARAAELVRFVLAPALTLASTLGLLIALALLPLPTLPVLPVLLELLEQLVEPVAQRLLVLLQLAHAWIMLTLLPLLAALHAVLLTLPLALLKGAVAQVLLPANHVAKLVEL
jgi:hypothetical protein